MSHKHQNNNEPQRLLIIYRKEIAPAMLQEFNYKNVMEIPRLVKVVLNIGLGEALTSANALQSATRDLSKIVGQKPLPRKAKNSIANFKLREGQTIGVSATLRGPRMWDFVDRFLNIALPRVRDFRGASRKGFDKRGNYSIGIREQVIFPEIDYNEIDKIRGLQVSFVTTAETDKEGLHLLELLGMPFTRIERR